MTTKDDTKRQTLTVDEVAETLGVNRNTVYAAIEKGQIPSIPVGRLVLIPAAWLERALSGELPSAAA